MPQHEHFFYEKSGNQIAVVLGVGFHPSTGRKGCRLTFIKGEPRYFQDRFKTVYFQGLGKNVYTLEYGQPLRLHIPSEAKKEIKGDGRPTELRCIKEALTIIQRDLKELLVYTGAGISKAAGIWGVDELKEQLYLSDIDKLTRVIATVPQIICNRFAYFITSLYVSQPTRAHFALRNLWDKYHFDVVTENLDQLHQKTGLPVIRREEVSKLREKIEKYRTLMTIGLSADFSSVISYFRSKSPDGTVLAINTSIPSYLGRGDYYLLGDVQIVLPEISNQRAMRSTTPSTSLA